MTPEHPASGVVSPVRRSAARDLTLAAVALASGTVAIAASWAGAPGPSFGFWLAACFAGELLWVRLPFGRATLETVRGAGYRLRDDRRHTAPG